MTPLRPLINRRRWLAGAGAVVLAACSSKPVPRQNFYRLDAAPAVTPLSGGPIAGTLEVPPFRATGILNERSIVYRDGNALAEYNYEAWMEPPPAMISRAFIDALRAAQAFTHVITPEMRLDRDYELTGTLRRWEQVLSPASVAIEIEIYLRRVKGNQQVLLKTYRADEPLANTDVDAALAAFNSGTAKIIQEFLGDLAALPR